MCHLSLVLGIIILLPIDGYLGQDISFPNERPFHHHRLPDTKIISTSTTSTTTTTTTTTTTEPPETIECPANMTATKEPDETEYFCECLQGNLYYAELDRCFGQYTIGPCEQGQLFILPVNASVPMCVENPCGTNEVVYEGSCYPLYTPGGPCDDDKVLTVPETSYQPECVEITIVSLSIIAAPVKSCGESSRRDAHGMCRTVLR